MTRIFFSAEQPLVAEGLRAVLARCPECDVRAVEPKPEGWKAAMAHWKPEIAIVEWSGHFEWDPLALLREAAPQCRAILLLRDTSPEMVFQAREAGAAGALSLDVAPEELIDAVRRVLAGEFVFDHAAADWPRGGARRVRLTPRESELVGLLVQGLKNKEIAAALGLTEGTVKVYLCKLFQKVGAKDRFELALFGLRNLAFPGGDSAGLAAPAGRKPRLRSLVVTPQEIRTGARLTA
ncbi:MAG: LuxR C-terminal-related transcriptional regulator [Bryobacteraceae bacterium]